MSQEKWRLAYWTYLASYGSRYITDLTRDLKDQSPATVLRAEGDPVWRLSGLGGLGLDPGPVFGSRLGVVVHTSDPSKMGDWDMKGRAVSKVPSVYLRVVSLVHSLSPIKNRKNKQNQVFFSCDFTNTTNILLSISC